MMYGGCLFVFEFFFKNSLGFLSVCLSVCIGMDVCMSIYVSMYACVFMYASLRHLIYLIVYGSCINEMVVLIYCLLFYILPHLCHLHFFCICIFGRGNCSCYDGHFLLIGGFQIPEDIF